ncbi:KAP family P-loop NTPase fold protein, partial [Cellvibrio sp.]
HLTLVAVREAQEYSYEHAYPSPAIKDDAYRAMGITGSIDGGILAITRAYNKEIDSHFHAKDASSALNESLGGIHGVVRSLPQVRDSLYSALQLDCEEALLLTSANINDFSHSPLWHEIPEWYSDGVNKLAEVINDLRKIAGQKSQWEIINAGLAFFQQSLKRSSANDYLSTNIYDADNPAITDKLNREALADALAINLTHSANDHHRAIGLLGEWGSGKSTVLKLLKKKLKEIHKKQPFVFGEFNAWAYEHSDNIQAGIAHEVLNAIANLESEVPLTMKTDAVNLGGPLHYAIKRFSSWLCQHIKSVLFRFWITLLYSIQTQKLKFLKISLVMFVAILPVLIASEKLDLDWLSWLGTLSDKNKSLLDNVIFQFFWGAGFGIYFLRELRSLMANPLSKELLTYIRLPDYAKHLGDIPVMRDNIKIMCNIRLGGWCGKPKRMLFVVDDLDRCSPESIVKVLEAVRLVLELKNVVVVVAIDQHIALAALSNHFKEFSSHHKLKNSHAVARAYLSKVINLPIVLTSPSRDDVKNYMHHLWSSSPNSSMGGINAGFRQDTSPANPQRQLDKIKEADPQLDPVPVEGGRPKDNPDIVSLSPRKNPIKSLSDDQRECFIYWVHYFGITNPRQLKRLNNSYDLMRNYFKRWDKHPVSFFFFDEKAQSVYPMLLTLILMEHLNSLEDLNLRARLWNRIFSVDSNNSVFANPNITQVDPGLFDKPLIDAEFIRAYRQLLQLKDYGDLEDKVKAFVLPAMT